MRMLPAARAVDPLPEEEDPIWFRDALQILLERRRVILTVVALVATALTAYAVMVPGTRLFEARAQMQVEPESPPPLDYSRPGGGADPESTYYETQYRILRSRALVRRTLASLSMPPHPTVPSTQTASSTTGAAAPGTAAPSAAAPSTAAPSATAPSASASAAASGSVSKDVAFADPPQARIDAIPPAAVDAFLRTLTIVHIPDSRLVEVRVQSPDPAYAVRAANAHTQAYIRQSVELTLLATRQASRWLAGEIDEERERVERGTAALEKYRQHDGALEEKQAMVAQRLTELNAAVVRARAQRVTKETAYQQVEEAKRAGRSPSDMAALVSSPIIQQLALDLANLQRKDMELSANYGERHPERIKTREAIAFTEQRLDDEIARAIDGLRRDVLAARQDEGRMIAALTAQTTESSALGRQTVDYQALKREVANDRTLFEKLQQRARELRLSSDYELSNIRVIDPAELPRAPLPDTRWRNIGLGAGGGVVLALLLAFGLHYLDERVRSPEDIKTHLGLPYLGMVPQIAAATPETASVGIARRIDVPLPFKEALRDLRTHVLCTPAGRASKILLVASAGMDEGKTMVATSLATGLAQIGNRVLLLDLDLRKPSVHEAFDLPLQPGLSELMSGTTRARDSVRPSDVRNLWVLPAGRPLANPGDLLSSAAFTHMMESLSKTFDRIVIDSPPVMAVTDASLIAHEEVGVVFVVSADRTGRRPARAALDRLEAVGARFVGVVLNRVDLKHDGSPYYLHYDDVYGDGTYDTTAAPSPAPEHPCADVTENRS